MKTKFAIGCLIQWYECDIIEEYVDSLKDAIEVYDGEVLVDFTICLSQDLEKCISKEKKLAIKRSAPTLSNKQLEESIVNLGLSITNEDK